MDIDYNSCRPTLDQITDDELAGPLLDEATGERGPGLNIAATITGMIYWDTLDNTNSSDPENVYTLLNADEYIAKIEENTSRSMSEAEKANIREKVNTEVRTLQQAINQAISTIESDPTVQFCMYGREVQGMKRGAQKTRDRIGEKSEDAARFPELTKQMRKIIAAQAIKVAKANYYTKYDELNNKMLQDYAKVGERLATIRKEDSLNTRREAARVACVNFAEASILALSPAPPKSAFGQILNKVITTASTVAMAIGTGGTSMALTGMVQGISAAKSAAGVFTAVKSGIAAAKGPAQMLAGGIAASKGFDQSGGGNGEAGGLRDGDLGAKQLIGSKQLNQWNYKETITSTFQWDSLVCHKCTKKQNCAKTKRPLFGSAYCKSWEDAVETCDDTQF